MRGLDVGVNVDGVVTLLHDYTQRTLEELFIRGPRVNPHDNPEVLQVPGGWSRAGRAGCCVANALGLHVPPSVPARLQHLAHPSEPTYLPTHPHTLTYAGEPGGAAGGAAGVALVGAARAGPVQVQVQGGGRHAAGRRGLPRLLVGCGRGGKGGKPLGRAGDSWACLCAYAPAGSSHDWPPTHSPAPTPPHHHHRRGECVLRGAPAPAPARQHAAGRGRSLLVRGTAAQPRGRPGAGESAGRGLLPTCCRTAQHSAADDEPLSSPLQHPPPLQFVDGFKSLVIPSHLRPPAQAINWIALSGDPAVDEAMQARARLPARRGMQLCWLRPAYSQSPCTPPPLLAHPLTLCYSPCPACRGRWRARWKQSVGCWRSCGRRLRSRGWRQRWAVMGQGRDGRASHERLNGCGAASCLLAQSVPLPASLPPLRPAGPGPGEGADLPPHQGWRPPGPLHRQPAQGGVGAGGCDWPAAGLTHWTAAAAMQLC